MEEKTIKKYKILYVGGYDDFINSLIGAEDLFDVVTTENGLTAMNFIQSSHDMIDAVLIEAHLPGINGIEIAKMFKGKTVLTKTPFIIVSPEYDEKFKKAAFEETTVNDYYSGTLVPQDIHTRIFYLKKWFELSEEANKTASAPRKEYKVPIEKRIFDIVVSAGALLVLSPLLLIVAIAIRLESKGKVFYSSKRVGTGYKIFDFYKFRSMRPNDDANSRSATKDDPRITWIGKIMRKTSLDEFPQFINVLKGDMSVVGPRPHMLKHTELYSELIGKFMVRHLVKPGITGWAQVCGFRGETKTVEDMEDRVQRDVWYIENWSMFLDVKIIFLTVFNVFKGEERAY